MFEYLDTLNQEQRKAATHMDGPLLIIAGAGSGKTTTLVNRIAYMVDNGVLPENILLLTFTNAAADNMKVRASKLSNPECGKVTASTYHSFCADILRKYGTKVGLSKDFVIITPNEELEAFKLCKSELGFGAMKNFPKAKDVCGIVSLCLNACTDLNKAIDEIFESDEEVRVAVHKVVEKVFEYKKENNLVSYDDLLTKMYELLQIEEVRFVLESHYKYVMVDEYQDTCKIQEKIVMLLTRDNKNIVVVGDDYQSIYRFRGAEISNIIEFPKRVGGCENAVIDTNYRSTKEILDVANEIMKANADFGYPKMMKDAGKRGSKVKMARPFNVEREAEAVYEEIVKWQQEGRNLSEFAVLERNSNSSARLEMLLAKNGIEFEKLGGLKFLEHQCVIDMLSFFKVISNQSDELSWFHLLDILPGIGEVYAHKVMSDLKTDSIENHPTWSKKGFYKDLLGLTVFIRGMSRNAGKMEFEKVFDLTAKYYFDIVKSKIEKMVCKDEETRILAMEQMKNDQETVGLLKEIAMKYSGIVEFLDSVVLDATPVVPNEGKVVISTIHSAKGMEWEHVSMLDAMDGIVPNMKNMLHDEDMEDLRCLYVALTRAKSEEVIYAPMEAMVLGCVYTEPSAFLKSSIELGMIEMPREEKKRKQKIYLNVSYYDKEEAKSYGAKWDGCERCWYCYDTDKYCELLIKMFGQVR